MKKHILTFMIMSFLVLSSCIDDSNILPVEDGGAGTGEDVGGTTSNPTTTQPPTSGGSISETIKRMLERRIIALERDIQKMQSELELINAALSALPRGASSSDIILYVKAVELQRKIAEAQLRATDLSWDISKNSVAGLNEQMAELRRILARQSQIMANTVNSMK